MELELMKEFSWEGSHVLYKHPGKCARIHGHSFKLKVYVSGMINKDTGFVMDYVDLKAIVKPIIDRLDHRHLGGWSYIGLNPETEKSMVPGLPVDFYPSSENLIVWIADQLGDSLDYPIVMKARSLGMTTQQKLMYWHRWSKLELDETCTSSCTLTREEYDK